MKTKHEIYYDKEKTKPVTDYEVNVDGYALLKTGKFYVFGESKVIASGEAVVVAQDEAVVKACDKAFVVAWQKARVKAFDNADVVARDEAVVLLYDNTALWADRTAKIIDKRANTCQNPS